MRYVNKLVGLVVVALPTAAAAHPGHGAADGESLSHYLFDHAMAPWVLAAVVVSGGVVLWRRMRR